jgi:hypothetical protein
MAIDGKHFQNYKRGSLHEGMYACAIYLERGFKGHPSTKSSKLFKYVHESPVRGHEGRSSINP